MKKILCGALFICFAMAACKKYKVENMEPGNDPASLLKLPHGAPVGPVVKVIIGSAGGIIKSADENIIVTVPAGAVDTNTVFSVEQVNNTLNNKAYSYRLKPDNVDFKKDININYYYGGIELDVRNTASLFLALQDSAGYYFSVNNTREDIANQTLTANTRHFSDWTFYARQGLLIEESRISNKMWMAYVPDGNTWAIRSMMG